ncbi:MAG: hypothetical protein PHH93_02985 [Prolixibacteraceae bacterium]|nr:hypothetical protein [Prolixibacteraceae bacterium]
MGRAYTYRCDHCAYEEQFNEGHGFLIHPLSLDSYIKSGQRLFHHKTEKVIKKLSENRSNLFINAGFKIYKCPKCNLLYSKVDVAIQENRKIVHKSEFRCNRCGARLKLTNIHRLKKAVCPMCRKLSFSLDHRKMALWD